MNKSKETDDTIRILKRMFGYVSKDVVYLRIAAVFMGFAAFLTLFGPPIMKEIIDLIAYNISGSLPLNRILSLSCVLIIFYIVSMFILMMTNTYVAKISQKMVYRIRNDIDKKINRLPVKYLDSKSKGDVISLVMNDADVIGASMFQIITISAFGIVVLIGCAVLMLITDLKIALVTLAMSFISVILISTVIRKSKKQYIIQQQKIGEMSAFITDNYNAHGVTALYGGKKEAFARFASINDEIRKSASKTSILSNAAAPMVNYAKNISIVIVMLFSSYYIMINEVTIGVAVAFLSCINIFFNPLLQLSQMLIIVESAVGGAIRIFKFLDEPEMPVEEITESVVSRGHVEFRNVGFSFTGDKEFIHDFSIDVKPGQKIAIVGATGAGKSTIVNLLMRFYEMDSGDILIDGVSIRDMTRSEVRDQFCMVLQDAWIFKGSVRDNIVFCRKDISNEAIAEACDAVGLTECISNLPDGLLTVLDSTCTLSEGQRQQLVLARACLDKRPMLIMDEATASIDTRMERKIQAVMDNLSASRTSFVIAHRLSTIRNADEIIVMDHGRIVEIGTHEELISKGGYYKELFYSQYVAIE